MKYMRILFIIAFLSPLYLMAQDTTGRELPWVTDSTSAINTMRLFCDPGYMSIMGGIGNIESLIFEADIIPYYMIGINNNREWGFALSPRVVLRMYNEESYPIRTPSYMPKVMFIQHMTNISRHFDWFYYIAWLHHSNGQEGNFFNEDSVSINTRTGDFYTNWVEGGFFLSRLKRHERFYARFLTQYCYKQRPELDGLYGRFRFNINIQSEANLSKTLKVLSPLYFEAKNITINSDIRLGYIGGWIRDTRALDIKRFTFSYALSFKPAHIRDITVFCQYYRGEDYYNIYFSRTLSLFRFGIQAKTSVFN